jgi:hypothetical protein
MRPQIASRVAALCCICARRPHVEQHAHLDVSRRGGHPLQRETTLSSQCLVSSAKSYSSDDTPREISIHMTGAQHSGSVVGRATCERMGMPAPLPQAWSTLHNTSSRPPYPPASPSLPRLAPTRPERLALDPPLNFPHPARTPA